MSTALATPPTFQSCVKLFNGIREYRGRTGRSIIVFLTGTDQFPVILCHSVVLQFGDCDALLDDWQDWLLVYRIALDLGVPAMDFTLPTPRADLAQYREKIKDEVKAKHAQLKREEQARKAARAA
jgi:hypothetical protein